MANEVIIPTTSQPLNNVQWYGVGILNLVHKQLKVMEMKLDGLAALGIARLSKAGFLLSSD